MRPKFWERPLGELTGPEWEALCDGCGKCCLNKLEDEDTGQVEFTRIACRLFDDGTCRCSNYETRLKIVPECVVLKPETMAKTAYFMPESCAYRLRHEGKPLPAWHPLVTGDPESTRKAGRAVRGPTWPEFSIPEDDWEDYIAAEEDL
ncbi:YcgN family cysteine cluster protein [Oceanicola sp. 502str15]|uniref:YcgN family cysteine cluster protein n=1 Tax=Oceanicola sp. 502str15 TaxID=2696061 RepID=UPI0020963886|nr:YcgN family cysteine cluster protein [Oceanicola sp. 502str15]MCO6383579.1 YcgN family cysteine cluster protein [Oceanicola sp. 502str15]